jgi:hypothetical protein
VADMVSLRILRIAKTFLATETTKIK